MKKQADNTTSVLLEECCVVSDKPHHAAIAIIDPDGRIDSKTGKPLWVWLPRSQITFEPSAKKQFWDVILPLWLAKEKGLV